MSTVRLELDLVCDELRLHTDDEVRIRAVDHEALHALSAHASALYRPDSTRRGPTAAQLARLAHETFLFLDGADNWLKNLSDDAREVAFHIPLEPGFRVVPWELLADRRGTPLAARASAPWSIIRSLGPGAHQWVMSQPKNRPLRVLFMAAAPEDAGTPLDYEIEEQLILEAVERFKSTGDDESEGSSELDIDLVVEESGSLAGIARAHELHGSAYFDVLHLSGHAMIQDDTPLFVMEDDVGRAAPAAAENIASAIGGDWPPLVFMSGCFTGGAPDEAVASLCESLVQNGAPAVIGWALPVGDGAASQFAAHLYSALATGNRLDLSVANARSLLYQLELETKLDAFWHTVRLYSRCHELTSLVTKPGSTGRLPSRHLTLDRKLLAPDTPMNVASRGDFVGRRKLIQRCLTYLRAPITDSAGSEVLILKGMAGLGKTTLAARLLERLTTLQPVVHIGCIDLKSTPTTATYLIGHLGLEDDEIKTFSEDLAEQPLEELFARLLAGPLADQSFAFVFDDFENGNLEAASEGTPHMLTDDANQVLGGLARAIRSTDHRSRIIVTSRYEFQVPDGCRTKLETLESFSNVELTKKLRKLTHLPGVQRWLRVKALSASGGNPRLLETIDQVVGSSRAGKHPPEVDTQLDAIAAAVSEFLALDVAAGSLLEAQQAEARELLAKVAVVRLPIPLEAVLAVHDHPDALDHIRGVAQVGLLEEGLDPETGQHRYFVSGPLRSLLDGALDEAQIMATSAAAARSLHQIWTSELAVSGSSPHTPGTRLANELRLSEVHRLALTGEIDEIVRPLGRALCQRFLAVSRFGDVVRVTTATLKLGPYADALYDLGWAENRLGQRSEALKHYGEALVLYQDSNRRLDEAATLFSIGFTLHNIGDRHGALDHYYQALAIQREVGNRSSEASTLTAIGLAVNELGDHHKALDHQQRALAIDRESGNEAQEAATLAGLGAALDMLGDHRGALDNLRQALALLREIGDRSSEAIVLNNIGRVLISLDDHELALGHFHQAVAFYREVGDQAGETVALAGLGTVVGNLGDHQGALDLFGQSLEVCREIGDRTGEAATLGHLGAFYNELGDWHKALDNLQQALPIQREIRNQPGEAITLNNLGLVLNELGDYQSALDYLDRALLLCRAIGHRAGEATTLNSFGLVLNNTGDYQNALDHLHRALPIRQEVGDRAGEAITLNNLGLVLNNIGDYQNALDHLHRALPIRQEVGDQAGEAATRYNVATAVQGLAQQEKALDGPEVNPADQSCQAPTCL